MINRFSRNFCLEQILKTNIKFVSSNWQFSNKMQFVTYACTCTVNGVNEISIDARNPLFGITKHLCSNRTVGIQGISCG